MHTNVVSRHLAAAAAGCRRAWSGSRRSPSSRRCRFVLRQDLPALSDGCSLIIPTRVPQRAAIWNSQARVIMHQSAASQAELELISPHTVQAQARSEAEAAAAGVSVYGIRHSCVLGACSPEELAALTAQVRQLWSSFYSATLCAAAGGMQPSQHLLARLCCAHGILQPSHSARPWTTKPNTTC